MPDYVDPSVVFGAEPQSPVVTPPQKPKVTDGAAWIDGDDEFNRLPQTERFKAQQLMDSGKTFHVLNGQVREGEYHDPNKKEYVDPTVVFGIDPPKAPEPVVQEKNAERSIGAEFSNWLGGHFKKAGGIDPLNPATSLLKVGESIANEAVIEPVEKVLSRSWEKISNRTLSAIGVITPGSPNYDPIGYGPFAGTPGYSEEQWKSAAEAAAHDRQIKQNQEDAPTERKYGEWGNTADLIFNDSLMANELKIMSGMSEQDWAGIQKARNIASQLKIVANPDKFPAVAVESAQREIDARLEKSQEGAGDMWRQLVKAFKDDPKSVMVELGVALRQDPEMLAAPVGLGMKVVTAGRIAKMSAGAAKIAGRANAIADAAITGGGLNAQITLAQQIAEGRDINPEEVALSGGIGAALSAPFGFLTKVAPRRVALEQAIKTGSPIEGIFDEALAADLAKEQNLIEDLVAAEPNRNFQDGKAYFDGKPLEDKDVARLRRQLGIDKMDAAQRKEFLKSRRAFISGLSDQQKSSFLAAKAADRLNTAGKLSADAERRAKQGAAEAPQQTVVSAALDEVPSARVARVSEEVNKTEGELVADPNNPDLIEKLDKAIDDLNAIEILSAASKGQKETNAAMEAAVIRDAKRKTPRYQAGEIDPKLVARLGAGSLFAGTAYALTEDPDYKAGAAFAAFLASAILPGGGSVARRLGQAGAIAADGGLIGAVVHAGDVVFPRVAKEEAELIAKGKLKPSSPQAERAAYDTALVDKIKAGNMDAFNLLYKEYAERLLRFIKKPSIGKKRPGLAQADAEDALQNTFVRIHQNLESFDPSKSSFSTWAHTIADNEAIRVYAKTRANKRGGQYRIESMHSKDVDVTGEHQVGRGNVTQEVEEVAADMDTPEAIAEVNDAQAQLEHAINTLPKIYKDPFILARVEGLKGKEAAERLGMKYENFKVYLGRADKMVQDKLAKGLTGNKLKAQGGFIDEDLLLTGGKLTAAGAVGGAIGWYLTDPTEDVWGNEDNSPRQWSAAVGATIAMALLTKGRGNKSILRQLGEGSSKVLEPISSIIAKADEGLLHKLRTHVLDTYKKTHAHFDKVAPFLSELKRLKSNDLEGGRVLERAILTGRPAVTDRVLVALNRPELTAAWKDARSTLDSLGDQLVALGRFKKGELEYFPRIVKNLEGLREALGTKHRSILDSALKEANDKMLKTKRRDLTDLERSLVINRLLREQEWNSHLPGYAKDRVINTIPDELLDFYHSPAESLHTYIRSAVKDVERAKFFGAELRTSKARGSVFTDIDHSIGAYVDKMLENQKITLEQRNELLDVMKSFFVNGEKTPPKLMQLAANLSYASLLGQMTSAASQTADVVIALHTQGLMPTLEGLVRTVARNKKIDVRALGLADHMAEEFADNLQSAKFLNKVFKASLFTGVDLFGKNVVLNAAVSKMGRLAKTEVGQAKLRSMYGRRLGVKEMDELINDLNKGEVSDLVQSVAFAELSRTQPISKLELPQFHLDNPKARILYQYKTFMIKQLDLLNQDGLQKIKQGKFFEGSLNLLKVATLLGMGGASASYLKEYMKNLYLSAAGHERNNIELKASDVPLNMFKTFGLTEYIIDHAFGVSKEEAEQRRAEGNPYARSVKAEPGKTALGMIAPAPAQLFDSLLQRGDGSWENEPLVKRIPLLGWILKTEQEARKAEEGD